MRTNCAHARCTSSLPLHYLCSKSTRGDFLSRHGLRSVHSDRAPPGVPGTMGQRLVHVEPPATRPRFNNVEPRSREERLAIRDKDTSTAAAAALPATFATFDTSSTPPRRACVTEPSRVRRPGANRINLGWRLDATNTRRAAPRERECVPTACAPR